MSGAQATLTRGQRRVYRYIRDNPGLDGAALKDLGVLGRVDLRKLRDAGWIAWMTAQDKNGASRTGWVALVGAQ